MDLKFWKKDDDDFDLPDFSSDSAFPDPNSQTSDSSSDHPDFSQGFSTPNQQEEPSFSAPVREPASQQQVNAGADNSVHQQLIIARLDAISNKLEVMANRIEKIESRLEQGPDQKQSAARRPWYAD